ncbi:hypothetical protein ACFLTZ_06950, partial [Chloroflexota bacterium]
NHALTERDKVTINLLWYSGMILSGMRLSEAAKVKARDFNWSEGTVVILGKGNRYRKAVHNTADISNASPLLLIQRCSRLLTNRFLDLDILLLKNPTKGLELTYCVIILLEV